MGLSDAPSGSEETLLQTPPRTIKDMDHMITTQSLFLLLLLTIMIVLLINIVTTNRSQRVYRHVQSAATGLILVCVCARVYYRKKMHACLNTRLPVQKNPDRMTSIATSCL